MIIEFVDLKSGNIFNGDQPYIHWFNEGQSTGLQNVESLCILSDVEELDISFPEDNGIFYLIELEGETTEINKKLFYNLNECKKYNITSRGTLVDNVYVHNINILANSDNAGEFIETLEIADGIETENFNVGADFYSLNEILEVNLKNFGFSIPNAVQKSIYDETLCEDLPDAILLNRKMKELLINYWDVLANKGSYDSLLNSLAWFEYGDFVKIREHWKKNEPDVDLFDVKELQDILDEKCREYLTTKTKTTMMGLYMALNKYKKKENGDVVLQDDDYVWDADCWPNDDAQTHKVKLVSEYMPILEDLSFKWDNIDLSLKMTILGNFFSTFFAPIHIDIIHSTVERITTAPTVKVISGGAMSRIDVVDNYNNLDINVVSNYYLRPTNFCTYPSTLFKDIRYSDYSQYAAYHVVGVEPRIRSCHNPDDLPQIVQDWSNVPACIVKFDCNIHDDGVIQREAITINGGEDMEEIASGQNFENYYNIDGNIHFDFNLAFYAAGHYIICLCFTSTSGRSYAKVVELYIKDDIRQKIHINKVVRKEIDDNPLETSLEMPELVFQQMILEDMKDMNINMASTQYVSVGREGSVGLNHTIVIDTNDPNSVHWKLEDSEGHTSPDLSTVTTNDLESLFSDYWWCDTERYVKEEDIPSGMKHAVIIGISKKFADEMEEGLLRLVENVYDPFNHLAPESNRIVCESRFYPLFHKYEDMTESDNRSFDRGTTIACVAEFDRTASFNNAVWTFHNATTGEDFKSCIHVYGNKVCPHGIEVEGISEVLENGTQGFLGADNVHYKHDFWDFTPVELTPGYYDVILNYAEDENMQTVTLKSAFRINK